MATNFSTGLQTYYGNQLNKPQTYIWNNQTNSTTISFHKWQPGGIATIGNRPNQLNILQPQSDEADFRPYAIEGLADFMDLVRKYIQEPNIKVSTIVISAEQANTLMSEIGRTQGTEMILYGYKLTTGAPYQWPQ